MIGACMRSNMEIGRQELHVGMLEGSKIKGHCSGATTKQKSNFTAQNKMEIVKQPWKCIMSSQN